MKPSRPATTTLTTIRVLVVDDIADIAEMIAQCIDREPDMASVGTLPSADGLARHIATMTPDVVLLDMSMPGADPMKALARLTKAQECTTRVILFSGHENDVVADAASKAGACGFLSKNAEVPVILNAIREAARWRKDADPFRVWA